MKMRVIYSILLLVVSPDPGITISDDHEVFGNGSSLYSCLALGGSCIPKGTDKSFSGGRTTRCFGQRECRNGFTCCLEVNYIADPSSSGTKKRRKKRQVSPVNPGRAPKCPSSDKDPRCGIEVTDQFNKDGGRCRKVCKQGKNSPEREVDENVPDNDKVCPVKFACKCCFRVKKCKKLKACTKQKGECRGVCLEGETPMQKGCKNGCTCCVPNDKLDLPDCEANGGRCTTKKFCNKKNLETSADDQFSCPNNKKGKARKCCLAGDAPTYTCEPEGGKCSKKKCDAEKAQRDLSDKFTCAPSVKGKKKTCCLKDCYHWRTDTWYTHGETHMFECEEAICKNGEYTTYGQKRNEKCCLDEANDKYYEEFEVKCDEYADHTEYSQICTNGSFVNQTELHESCIETVTKPTSEGINDENEASRLILEDEKKVKEVEDEDEKGIEEEENEEEEVKENNNESNQEDPSEGGNKFNGNGWKGKWVGKNQKMTGTNIVKTPGVIQKGFVKKPGAVQKGIVKKPGVVKKGMIKKPGVVKKTGVVQKGFAKKSGVVQKRFVKKPGVVHNSNGGTWAKGKR